MAEIFKKKLEKTEPIFKQWFEGILDQLSENPFVGKPLSVEWFREKKFEKFRIYFLIYEDSKTVYVVNMSEKKNQQAIINSIRVLFDEYKNDVKRLLGN